MPIFRISGADKSSGADVAFDVEAESQSEAEAAVSDRMFISSSAILVPAVRARTAPAPVNGHVTWQPQAPAYHPPVQQTYVHLQQQPTNGLGTAGFIVSLLGLVLTCGVLSPLGLLFSIIAIFKRPRGMAIAGLILGAVGSLWIAFGGLVLVAGIVGIGATVDAVGKLIETDQAAKAIVAEAQAIQRDTGKLPDSDAATRLAQKHPDGWGTMMRYVSSNGSITLTSAGADRQFGTADDKTYIDGVEQLGGSSSRTPTAPSPTPPTRRP